MKKQLLIIAASLSLIPVGNLFAQQNQTFIKNTETVIAKNRASIVIMGKSHLKELIPITAGNEANKEPHALLEFVSKIDQPIDNKKRSEMPFLI